MAKDRIKVLLGDSAEDDYIMIRNVLSGIEGLTCELDWVTSRRAVLEAIGRNEYDICFLDHHFTERGGGELTDKNEYKVPIVLLTDQERREDDIKTKKIGAADYLIKDMIDAAMIERSIRYVIERKQAGEELRKNEHDDLEKIFRLVEKAKAEWERSMDCINDMVILVDNEGKIKRCNRALKEFVGKPYEDILGNNWEHLLREHRLGSNTFHGQGVELFYKPTGKWFILNTYPSRNIFMDINEGETSGMVITIHDSTELKKVTEEMERKNSELEKAYKELKGTQSQMFQQEKMASIGQLAAGVAHEINNPMSFISSNLGALNKYVLRLTEFIRIQSAVINSHMTEEALKEIKGKSDELKIDYIIKDIKELIAESLDGAERVRKIVQNLKSFSRNDEAEYKKADINECIDGTINIVWNELKYKTTVKKEYAPFVHTKCYPQQMNQVFMNLLVNAAHAIKTQGEIGIKTWMNGNSIFVSISDTGIGIPPENLSRIFEPFYTTKDADKGTGLGLSIAYDIIKKHNGYITVDSEVGKGTSFVIQLPVVME